MLYTRISILKTWVAASYISSSSRSVFAKEEAVFSSCWKKKGNNISFRCPPPSNGLLLPPSAKGCRVVRKRRNEESCCTHPKKGKKEEGGWQSCVIKDGSLLRKRPGGVLWPFLLYREEDSPQRSSHDISKCSVRVYTYSKRAVTHIIQLIHK